MPKLKIIKGDKVLVITGKDRGQTGIVERTLPKKNQVVVTGLNQVKKHLKRSAKNPQGGIITLSKPIHISNVMILDASKNKPTRIGWTISGSEKVRQSKLSKEVISGAKTETKTDKAK